MTTNTFARPFFEFLSVHDLSLYKVAKTAEISEGTLRYFRDIEGRQLNWQTRQAVARALRQLTNEQINIVYLFGTPDQQAEARGHYFSREVANTRFADALCKNGFNDRSFVDITGIDERVVAALINNDHVDIVGARQIADILGETLEGIGYLSDKINATPNDALLIQGDTSIRSIDLPRNLPIRELNKRENGRSFITGRIIGYTVRPPSLLGNRDAYALYVNDNEMSPRLRKGELIYVDPHWPSNPISDVVINIRSGDDAGNVLIAALTMREGDRCAFTFYRRDDSFVFDEADIDIHKILEGQELIVR